MIQMKRRSEKSLKDLQRQLELFDPLHKGPHGTGKNKHAANGDDSDEEADNLRERFEMYKMVRKIEPELPPLDPKAVPPLPTSKRLADNPQVEYNLSEAALASFLWGARTAASRKRKTHR